MIGTLAYLAALGAPEIASAASDATAGLVEAAGRRFAAGMADEMSARFSVSGTDLLGLAMGNLRDTARASVNGLQEDIVRQFSKAVHGGGFTVIADEELALLREIAAAAATHGDVADGVSRLKAFLKHRAGPT